MEDFEPGTTAAGFLDQMAEVGAVNPARHEVLGGQRLDAHIQKDGLARAQPFREMPGLVRESAHLTGGNIEKVQEIVGAIGDAPAKGGLFINERDPQMGVEAGEMDGYHGAREARADDRDIEKRGILNHGTGGIEKERFRFDYTIPV
jgi:hypothetical protein